MNKLLKYIIYFLLGIIIYYFLFNKEDKLIEGHGRHYRDEWGSCQESTVYDYIAEVTQACGVDMIVVGNVIGPGCSQDCENALIKVQEECHDYFVFLDEQSKDLQVAPEFVNRFDTAVNTCRDEVSDEVRPRILWNRELVSDKIMWADNSSNPSSFTDPDTNAFRTYPDWKPSKHLHLPPLGPSIPLGYDFFKPATIKPSETDALDIANWVKKNPIKISLNVVDESYHDQESVSPESIPPPWTNSKAFTDNNVLNTFNQNVFDHMTKRKTLKLFPHDLYEMYDLGKTKTYYDKIKQLIEEGLNPELNPDLGFLSDVNRNDMINLSLIHI